MTDRKGRMYNGFMKCPFCGAENTDTNFIGHTQDCYLMLKWIGVKDLKAAWNKRPQEEALEEELQKLQKEQQP